MQWDPGLLGLAVLAAMSLVFGVLVQLILGKAGPRWTWLISACLYFVSGLVVSEVWFGWATEAELQPNIDGLSFDEVQLVTLFGLIAAVILRLVLRRQHARPSAAGNPREPDNP
ncbi:hypothetical protein ACFFGR_04385 [Arthrobacter liuii]|uniref:Lycopene cyclase domain-containing protein n=1 Tax=Arthrobacter liuii TaxID=1476996 RepID=A0ABQ2AJG2_9MICC|nr:hypothetical protein [Arthrobacter liuii]GGH92296.1 hypothetical protein GCM10007170_10520 [Arthrobacter liuii]